MDTPTMKVSAHLLQFAIWDNKKQRNMRMQIKLEMHDCGEPLRAALIQSSNPL